MPAFLSALLAKAGINVGTATGAAAGDVAASGDVIASGRVSATGSVSATGGVRGPRSSGAAVFGFDSSALGSSISIANAATVNPYGASNVFSGLVIVYDEGSGTGAMFMIGGGANCVKVAESQANYFSNVAGTAGRINVYVVAGSYYVQIQNNYGSTRTLHVTLLKFKGYT